MLSVLSKIFEKVLDKRLRRFFIKYNILTPDQHGYAANRSTESAAASLSEFIYKNLDDGLLVAGLFFDLSKAFDTLDSEFMKCKLHALGVRGNTLRLIMSYLANRKFCVDVEGSTSSVFVTNTGVPQGSVLGPLLFLLYINDMPSYINADHLTLYADDTTAAVSASSGEGLTAKIEVVMSDFKAWCWSNKLVLNLEKTVIILFTPTKRKVIKLHLNNNCRLDNSTKFLGLYLDQNLTWENQVDAVCKKLKNNFYLLLNIKTKFSRSSLITVYYALIYSHLNNNIILWGNSVGNRRVFVLQKRIIRLIFNLKPKHSCRTTFKTNSILPLPSIYILKTLLFIKENLNLYPTNAESHSYNTRERKMLVVPLHRTAKYELTPSYVGIKLYRHLPDYFRTLSKGAFKKQIKKLLKEKCYYSVEEFFADKF